MNFRKLALQDAKEVDRVLGDQEQWGWETDFAMIWAWDVFDETKICVEEETVFVYNVFFGKTVFFPPFVSRPELFATAVDRVVAFCREKGIDPVIKTVSSAYANLLDGNKYNVIADRDNFDYLYSAEDLRELRGKKFHAKRNYVSRFTTMYQTEFRPYEEADFDTVMGLYDAWHVKSVHETLDAERLAIVRALKSREVFDLKIALLFADSQPAAFSISRYRGKKIAHTFFEKGDIKYVGVYQTLNKLNAEMYFKQAELVNRQEDMGIEGLRKVKLSYNPVQLLEKFTVTPRV